MNDDVNKYHQIRVKEDYSRIIAWIEVAKYLQKYIDQDESVLELGAGKCLLINNFKAKKRIAVDLYKDIKLFAGQGVQAYSADCSKLDFIADNSIKTIVSACLFEHLEWDKIILTIDDAYRVLKDDGKFICIVPNFKYNSKKYFDDYTHRTILTEISFSEFLRSKNFEIELSIPRFLPDPGQSIRKNNFKIPFLKYVVRLYLNSFYKPFGELFLIIAKKGKEK